MGLTVQYVIVAAIVAVVLVLIVLRLARMGKGDAVCSDCSLRECCDKRKAKSDRKIAVIACTIKEKALTLHRKRENRVPWMSGLVNGLQNRLRRFESARDLKRAAGSNSRRFFCVPL